MTLQITKHVLLIVGIIVLVFFVLSVSAQARTYTKDHLVFVVGSHMPLKRVHPQKSKMHNIREKSMATDTLSQRPFYYHAFVAEPPRSPQEVFVPQHDRATTRSRDEHGEQDEEIMEKLDDDAQRTRDIPEEDQEIPTSDIDQEQQEDVPDDALHQKITTQQTDEQGSEVTVNDEYTTDDMQTPEQGDGLTRSASSDSPAERTITILPNAQGFVRVRRTPNIHAQQITTVHATEHYSVVDERYDWLQITDGKRLLGWISSVYAR